MKVGTLDVLMLTIFIGATPHVPIAQTASPAPAQTVTAGGLQIALLSFERAPSRSVSLGGNCPPGGAAGTVQGTLKEGTILLTAKVGVKVLPTYKAAKELTVVLQDEKERKYGTDTRLGDWGNPGNSSAYDCSLQFVGPDNVSYRKLQIGAAVFSLDDPKK